MQATRGVNGSRVPFVFFDLGELTRLDPILSREKVVKSSMNELVALIARNEDSVKTSSFDQYLTSVNPVEREQIKLLASVLLGAMWRDVTGLFAT